jgi:hypothetical protein
VIGGRCNDFKNILAEKLSEKIGVSDQKYCKFIQKMIITLVFEKNANIFCRKMAKNRTN